MNTRKDVYFVVCCYNMVISVCVGFDGVLVCICRFGPVSCPV